jgi:folate-binding Fe-S cluster repair protein YgfZ
MLAAGVALASRRVLRIGGTDALTLLQRVLTNDVRGRVFHWSTSPLNLSCF